MDDPVAKKGRGKIGITGLFEQGTALCRKIVRWSWKRRTSSRFVLLLLICRGDTRCLSIEKHRGAPGFAEPVRRDINVQIVPGDGNVDQVSRDRGLGTEV